MSMKCYRCKIYKSDDFFELKRNGNKYKCCSDCRNKKTNEEFIPVEFIPPEIIEDILTPYTEPPKPPEKEEKEDLKEKQRYIKHIKEQVLKIGFNLVEFDQRVYEDLIFDNSRFLKYLMIEKKMIMINETTNELFLPIKTGIYLINIKNYHNLFDNFVKSIKFNGKRRCSICCNKTTRCFKSCCRCHNILCCNCFEIQIEGDKLFICPFCRNEINDHLNHYIKSNSIRYKDIIQEFIPILF